MSSIRIVESGNALLVYRTDGRTPRPEDCEDAGEDAGYFDPVQERNTDPTGPSNSILVKEGFQGELCEHEWGFAGHYSRNPYGTFNTCKKCGVFIATATKKRSTYTEYTYDRWSLREHIWHRWLKRGPVPGSLNVQAHHQKGGAP